MTRRTRPMRHARTPVTTGPSRRLTRRGVTVGAVIGLTLSALPAWAYWTSSSSTSATATADALQPPATVTAAPTGMTSIQVKVTAAPASGPPPTAYRIFRGATQICTGVTVTLNSATCTDTNLAPGTAYTYTAVSLLQSNWFSAGSTSATTSTQPFPAPTVNVDSGTPGDGITTDTTPRFSGTAPPNATVTVRLDSTTLGTDVADASGNWSFQVTSSGTISRNVLHTVTARFTGNGVTYASGPLSLLIDTQAPSTGTVTSSCSVGPTSGYCKDGVTTVSVNNVADPSPGSGVASMTYSIAGGSSGTVALTNGAGSFSYNTPDGSPSITLTATDGAGNQSSSTTSATLAMDNSGPTVTGVTLTDNGGSSRAQAGDTLAIAFSDPGSGINPRTFCTTWSTTATSQNVAGNGVVTVTITDNGTASDTLTVTAPSACSGGLSIGSVALGANYVTGAALTFNGTGTNASRVDWSGTTANRTGVLTITLGTLQTGTASSGTGGQPVYSASTSIKDALGHGVANSPYTGTSGRF